MPGVKVNVMFKGWDAETVKVDIRRIRAFKFDLDERRDYSGHSYAYILPPATP